MHKGNRAIKSFALKRFNKNVKLPKPLTPNKEFECETRKREFYSAFNKYKQITMRKKHKKKQRIGKRTSRMSEENNIMKVNKIDKLDGNKNLFYDT